MSNDYNQYQIKALLEKLNKKGVESVYRLIKTCKPTSGITPYSALISDLIGCCPSADEWRYPRVRVLFEKDVVYYCKYYLSEDNKS